MARAGFATHENRVADPIRQQRADDDRSAEQSDLGFERRRVKRETVFQQNRILAPQPLQLCGKQTERGDRRQIQTVFHGDKLRVAIDLEVLRWIELGDIQVFIDRLGLHIVFGPNLRRDLIPRRARDDDADELFAAAFDRLVQLDLGRRAALKVERIERRLNVEGQRLQVRQQRNLREQDRGRLRFRAENLR
jgi:hypothetical protein